MPGDEEIGVLAEPSDPSAMGGCTVNKSIVIGHNAGAVTGGLEFSGNSVERGAEICVVVASCIPGDSSGGCAVRSIRNWPQLGLAAGIGPCRNDKRCRSSKQRFGFG
jgi:hypothetical protein